MEILALVLYIAIVCFGIGLFLWLVGISLFIGGVSGLCVGLYNGFKNYFSSLFQEMKLRK